MCLDSTREAVIYAFFLKGTSRFKSNKFKALSSIRRKEKINFRKSGVQTGDNEIPAGSVPPCRGLCRPLAAVCVSNTGQQRSAEPLRPPSTLTTALWTLLTHWIYNPVANFILSLYQQMK